MGAAFVQNRFKYILRDLSRERYLDASAQWTNDLNAAMEFSSVEEAVAAGDKSGICDASIVEHLSFDLGSSGPTDEKQILLEALRRSLQ